jgi:hypothetical protein
MGKAAELTDTLDEPATDEAILAAALAFANGDALTLHLDHKTLTATDAQRRELSGWLERALIGRAGMQDIAPLLGIARGIKLSYIVNLAGDGGVRLSIHRHFRTARSVLALAAVLAMDNKHDIGSKVYRCKLQTCKSFFLAKQNPKGGPPNRTYCCPEHLKEHHDSSNRRLGYDQ